MPPRAVLEEGRRLYLYGKGTGAQLPEEVAGGVEEDYQICLRASQRASAQVTGKKQGRKPGRKAQDQNED